MKIPDLVDNFDSTDRLLKMIAPMGYVFALNVRSTTPQFVHVTFSDKWWNEYRDNRYRLFDPMVHWASANTGVSRWSDVYRLPLLTINNLVMKRAASEGLCFGLIIARDSIAGGKKKSFFSASRTDREFSNEEVEILKHEFDSLANKIETQIILTKEEKKVLEAAAEGMLYKETAIEIGKSVYTVKSRLTSARSKLGAKTTTQAVLMARARNLLELSGDLEW